MEETLGVVCCGPPPPFNLLCVVGTTLSPVALSVAKGSCCSVLVVFGTVRVLWWGYTCMIRSRCPDGGSLWIEAYHPSPFLLVPIVVLSRFVFFF
jgi:hypothetical protein